MQRRRGALGDGGTILVIDSDERSRSGAVQVAARLGYDARAVGNSDVLIECLDGDRPALAIVQVEFPGPINGLELLRELHERFGDELPVILVSADRTAALDRVAGLMLGADDYLATPFDSGELLARVRRSLRRSSATARNGAETRADEVGLSPREREVLALLADGKTEAQIASALFLSPKTVSTHIQHVLAKLGVHSRAQAVAVAFRLGFAHPDTEAHTLSPDALPDVAPVA